MRYITTTKNLFDVFGIQTRNTGVSIGSNTVYSDNILSSATSLVIFSKNYVAGTYTITRGNTYGGCTNVRLLLSIRPDSTYIYNDFYKMYYKEFTTITFTANENFTIGFILLGSGTGGVYNIQLELGSTATPYVPYGYLPMYKERYKVSNVCQLLDKSKYPATQTINGVTFTNNGDGTITANGTATANSTFNLVHKANLLTIIDHKYLLIGCPEGGNTSSTYYLRYDSDGGTAGYDVGNGVIFTRTNEKVAYINIRILANYTANNLVFKPQLFDLTEMFGAGNEPTSVAEFKEKFPDDLYPYSPYCWAKIRSLIYKDNIDYIKMK